MSMQATTVPGYAPINLVIADCESNWARWQQLLPLGRSYPIDYLWREVEEGLPIGIELDARTAVLMQKVRERREQTQTFVLIPTDEESAELKKWVTQPRAVPEHVPGESVGDALRRARDTARNNPLAKLLRKYKIPEKAIFLLNNSALVFDNEIRQIRFDQRGEWHTYLDQNHSRHNNGWSYKEPEAS